MFLHLTYQLAGNLRYFTQIKPDNEHDSDTKNQKKTGATEGNVAPARYNHN